MHPATPQNGPRVPLKENHRRFSHTYRPQNQHRIRALRTTGPDFCERFRLSATRNAGRNGLLDGIRERWTVPDGRILGHSDVAPARKEDPGELFPWKRLAEAGHGLWVAPPPSPGDALRPGDTGVGVFALQAGLHRLGYDNAPSGAYDEATRLNVTAFQRHWRPSKVDGEADGETRARLVHLLRLAAESA